MPIATETARVPHAGERVEATGPRPRKVDRQGARSAGYVAAIVVNAAMLYAAHNVLDWDVGFVTPAWSVVVWAVDLSIAASLAANVLYLAYDPRWFRSLGEAITTGLSILVALQFWAVFPFDFGAWNQLARVGIVAVLLALAIAIVVQVVTAVAELVRLPFRSRSIQA